MEQQTFEGTWEEILLRASELTGRRVRLIILTNETSSDPSTDTLDKSLQGRVGQSQFSALVATAETLNQRQIFTLDRDFHIYRFRGNQSFEVVP
ncbi:hypothetical protein [Nostoc sp.]|uniref:hypothetical protein n=1 Tax=Nostoc sp. TaxID=1180 RepID=UPI002FFB6070